MLGSDQPLTFDPAAVQAALERPGVLDRHLVGVRLSGVDGRDWVAVIERQRWLDNAGARQYAGDGPLITDDHPRPEYFLLRRLGTPGSR